MSDQSFMERFGPRLVANGYPILAMGATLALIVSRLRQIRESCRRSPALRGPGSNPAGVGSTSTGGCGGYPNA